MEKDFEFKDVPAGFQLCFNAQCPRCGTCLRYLSALKVPSTHQWGPCIYPTVLKDDGSCPFFHQAVPLRMAWGFSKFFYQVLNRDVQGLREALFRYLGGKTAYYRYHRGKKLLTPEQQAWVLNCFRQAGYTEGLEFEGYVTTYDFSH